MSRWHPRSWFSDRAELRDSLENPSTPLSNPAKWLVDLFGGGKSSSGVSVTADVALSVPAYWQGVNFISGTLASLPLQVFERIGDSETQLAKKHRLWTTLHDAPNAPWLTSYRWRRLTQQKILTRGRGVTRIERNLSGRATGRLFPLETERVRVERKAGNLQYVVELDREKDGTRRSTETLPPEEVLDLLWMDAGDGICHIDPISLLKDAIGLSKALEEFGARFFRNGARPGIIAEIPSRLSEEAATRLQKSLADQHTGGPENAHGVIVLEDGVKVHIVQIEPEHAQFLESRRLQVEEIARILNLPPVFLQDLTNGTFSNTEQQDLHFVKHALQHWIRCWEDEINLKLFSDGPASERGRYFARFNVDGLLRGDFKGRMEGLSKAVQNSLMTPNEARETGLKLPPEPGGDQLFVQQNMVSLTNLGDAVTPPTPPQPSDDQDDEDGDDDGEDD